MSRNVRFTDMVGECIYFTRSGENIYITDSSGDPVYYGGHLRGDGKHIVNPEKLPPNLKEEWDRYGR